MDLQIAKPIFTEAVGIASLEARAAYLDAVCADNPGLRAQVESLLAAQSRLGSFLEPTFTQKSEKDSDAVGTRIGPYKILQQIGEGGFGIVYMAEQEQPLRRKVALKIIKPGMDTKQVIARFEVERQALALMDHPNIARVFDAGVTEGRARHSVRAEGESSGSGAQGTDTPCLSPGRPYFVMELVKGVPITEFCDRKQLTARARIELFIHVCNAVQHAHQKGIIHRDLKPSNVMITMVDGQPTPKVIDFGVAKAIEQRLTEKTLFTRYDQMIGTPAYMSPEQAELSGQDVDTRSDIYALGCLLYELLTGTAPIEKETLRKAGLDEIRRLIRETDPPTPSTRVRQQMAAIKVGRVTPLRAAFPNPESGAHGVTRPTRKSDMDHVRGDLDWIVMKCLEKDRARRYATTNGLAMDLQRFLNDEPVVARPPGNLYRCRKFARRHRLSVILVGGITTAIAVGMILALIGFAEARRERDRALAAEKRATDLQRLASAEATRSSQVATFLKQMLRGVEPSVAQGRDTTMLREILELTAARVDAELAGQPDVEADLLETLGEVYCALGDFTNAAARHLEALRLRRELYGEYHLLVAESLYWLADARQRERKYAEAEKLFREALAIRQRLLGDNHRDVALALNRLAGALHKQGGVKRAEAQDTLAQAETLFQEMLEAQRAFLQGDLRDVLFILDRLYLLLARQGKDAETEAVVREIVSLHQTTFPNDQLGLGSAQYRLAHVLRSQGKVAEAETASREALALWRNILPADHPQLRAVLRLNAVSLDDLGRLPEAETLLREALAAVDKSTPGSWEHGVTQLMLGRNLLRQKQYPAAESLLLNAHESLRRDTAQPPPAADRWYLAETLRQLVKLYEETGKTDPAAQWQQKLAEFDQTSK